MSEWTFRPIVTWPVAPTAVRRHASFRATWNQTLGLLGRELTHLKARNIVVEVAVDAAQIRRDGALYADARPRHPGVILSFDSKHGALRCPCDTYDDWRDNLRAIALALESLRAVDRYGVTRRSEQYAGWSALPSPVGQMTLVEAKSLIAKLVGFDIDFSSPNWATAVRVAERKTHPDAGGSGESFKRVQEAKRVLAAAKLL